MRLPKLLRRDLLKKELDQATSKGFLTDKTVAFFEFQVERFKDQFGRLPQENDPLFFDVHSEQPSIMPQKQFDQLMEHARSIVGMSYEKLYAIKKTGFILSQSLSKVADPQDIKEWDEAIKEYRNLN